MSYWAAVPHYVAAAALPEGDARARGRAGGRCSRRASRCSTFVEDARAWERGVDELAEEDEDVADYVRALEETRDTTELPEASGEAIAARVRALPQARRGGVAGDFRDECGGPATVRLHRTVVSSPPRVTARARGPSRAAGDLRTRRGVGGVGEVSGRAERGVDRGLHRVSAAGVSRSSARAASTLDDGQGRARRRPARAPCARESTVSTASQSRSSVHSSRAVVVPQQDQPDGHGSTSLCRRAETKTRLPFDFDIFSPS